MPTDAQLLAAHPALFIAGLVAALCFAVGLALDVLLVTGLCTRRWTLRQRSKQLLDRPWTWLDLGILLLVLLGAQTLLGGWVAQDAGSPGGHLDPVLLVLQTLLFHGLAGLLIVLRMQRRGLSWRTAFGAGPASLHAVLQDTGMGVLLYVAAIPPVVVLALLYRVGLNALDVPLDPQPVVTLFVSPDNPLWLRIYLALVAVALAPLVEEMCFRGIALPLFCRAGGMAAGIVAVSLLFAMVHFHVPSLMPLFGIAVAFALGYLVTGSLLTPIVMHALFNAVSLVFLYLLHDVPGLAGLL